MKWCQYLSLSVVTSEVSVDTETPLPPFPDIFFSTGVRFAEVYCIAFYVENINLCWEMKLPSKRTFAKFSNRLSYQEITLSQTVKSKAKQTNNFFLLLNIKIAIKFFTAIIWPSYWNGHYQIQVWCLSRFMKWACSGRSTASQILLTRFTHSTPVIWTPII